MPFGNQPAGSTGVNAGVVMPRPVVTAATPSAVQQLSDAYHRRLITGAQIGQYLATKTGAANAENAQNRLATRTAQAAGQAGLPEAAAALQKTQLDREKAALQYGDTVKEVPPTLKDDGTIDWAHTAARGYKFRLATAGLQAGTPIISIDKAGNKYTKIPNTFNEDITPGSDAWKFYQKLRQEALLGMIPSMDKSHPDNQDNTGGPPTRPAVGSGVAPTPSVQPAAGTPGTPVIQSNGVTPSDLTPNQMRAQLASLGAGYQGQGKSSAATDWNSISDPDVVRIWHQIGNNLSPVVQPQQPSMQQMPITPSTPPATPQVVPNATPGNAGTMSPMVQPQLGTYVPGRGLMTEESSSFGTPSSIVDELHKQKSYEAFDQQKGYANNFMTTAQKIAAIPPAQQKGAMMNQHDQSLAESLIKMYDPQGTIREFKWDKFADNQPLLERLKNAQSEILQQGTFTPQTRSRLIGLGLDTINAKEAAVAPQVQLAAQRLQQAGIDPATQLDTDELRAGSGQKRDIAGPGYVPDNAPPGAQPTGSPNLLTLPSGRVVVRGADNQWYDYPVDNGQGTPVQPQQQQPVVAPADNSQ